MDLNTFREYLNIHRISLLQDLDKTDYVNAHHFYKVIEAQVYLCDHLLGVLDEH